MKIRPWLCALLMWSLLGGSTACSDSSEEVAALKAQVEELQAQVNATSTRAPAVTEAPATTRAPATTTTQARFTAEEEAWIESELSTFVDEAGLGVTKIQARCIMKGFVEARGITGAGELLERVDAELNSGGRLSASDADAFLEPVVACANLVGITRLDIRRTEPSVDASCMVNGLQESQVADWYRTAYVEGEEVALAAMEDWMSSRIPACMATTTQAPTTTSGFKGAWKTSVEQDLMDDSWTTTFRLDAVEPFTDWFNTERQPVLYLRCQEGYMMEVFLYLGEARFADWDGKETHKTSLRYRIGDKPAVSADVPTTPGDRLSETLHRKVAFLDDDVQIIRELRGASRMVFEVDVERGFTEKTQEVLMTFDTRGLEYHLPLLTKHCPGQL